MLAYLHHRCLHWHEARNRWLAHILYNQLRLTLSRVHPSLLILLLFRGLQGGLVDLSYYYLVALPLRHHLLNVMPIGLWFGRCLQRLDGWYLNLCRVIIKCSLVLSHIHHR